MGECTYSILKITLRHSNANFFSLFRLRRHERVISALVARRRIYPVFRFAPAALNRWSSDEHCGVREISFGRIMLAVAVDFRLHALQEILLRRHECPNPIWRCPHVRCSPGSPFERSIGRVPPQGEFDVVACLAHGHIHESPRRRSGTAIASMHRITLTVIAGHGANTDQAARIDQVVTRRRTRCVGCSFGGGGL